MRRRLVAVMVVCALAAACSGTAPAVSPPPSAASVVPASAPASPVASAASFAIASPPGSARPDLLVTSVGDSIPYGGDDCGGCATFPQLFGDWIAATTGKTVDVANLSQHDGNTAARMAVELPQKASVEMRLADSDVIILTIGHNDVPWGALDDTCDGDHGFFDGNPNASWTVLVGPCLKTEVARYRKNLTSILDEIVRLRAGKPTAYRFTTQYNDIPGDPCCPAEATTVAATTKDAYNAAACEVAKAKGFVCVDVYHLFNGPKGIAAAGPLLAGDHTHPSAAGHAKIAQLLEAAGLAPIG